MLPTNYRNDVLNTSVNEKRRYNIISNADDTVSFEEVTSYTQEGTVFGANDINATNTAINTINVYVGDDKKLHFVNGEGADSALPFNPLPDQIKVKYGLDHHGEPRRYQTAIYTKQADNSYTLTSGGNLGASCTHIWESYHRETFTSNAVILGIEFVYN